MGAGPALLSGCNGAHLEGSGALILGIPLMLLFLYVVAQVGEFFAALWARMTGRVRAERDTDRDPPTRWHDAPSSPSSSSIHDAHGGEGCATRAATDAPSDGCEASGGDGGGGDSSGGSDGSGTD
ncbi:MAG: hypothetical protein NW201_12610 [Gemmatimonadales bacterium]|nr:hypothetical protein [Gemmatimonadales bacterium]